MAKKQSRSIQSRHDLSQAMRHMAERLDAWKQERTAIAAEFDSLIAGAKRLFNEAGQDIKALALDVTGPLVKRKGGRPKGYKMSAATRRKLREAWKRRKAAAAAQSSKG